MQNGCGGLGPGIGGHLSEQQKCHSLWLLCKIYIPQLQRTRLK